MGRERVKQKTNHRPVVAVVASGQAKQTQWSAPAQNKPTVTFTYTLNGFGAITPGADSSNSEE